VAAVVPLGTLWATTRHDSARQHAEQAQSDRAELRGVLDDAAKALYTIKLGFDDLDLGSSASAKRGWRAYYATYRPLRRRVYRLADNYNRVAIRLGLRHRATEVMREALDTASRISVLIAGTRTRIVKGNALDDWLTSFYRESNRYAAQARLFVQEAHAVARAMTE
jgi:hypothetical protein